MPSGRLVLNHAAFRRLLSRDVEPVVREATEAIHAEAGGDAVGFDRHVDVIGDRVVGRVVAVRLHARRAEEKDGRLSRAVDAGRTGLR